MTSFQVVNYFKKNLPKGFGKIGHFGTLDPFAEGVLLLGLGKAPRLNDYIHRDLPKKYMAVGKFGEKTDTADKDGQIVEKNKNLSRLELDEIKNVCDSFNGDYLQLPPAYSAVKVNGRRLYDYARQGKIIEVKPKMRKIFNIEVLHFQYPYLIFTATVGPGTYIRTLFEDIAKRLGTVGHLTELLRMSVGKFSIQSALRKEKWPKNGEFLRPAAGIFGIDEMLNYPKITLPEENFERFRCGNQVQTQANIPSIYWVYTPDNRLRGLGKIDADLMLSPVINFFPAS